MEIELLSGSRAAALREVLRSLECEAATKALLDTFLPDVPGVQPYVPISAAGSHHLIHTLAAAGTGFSIDSPVELEAVCAVGIDAGTVLYRNTVKHPNDVRAAALRGVWRFAIKSQNELSTIAGAAPGAATYVYVSVPDRAEHAPSGTSAYEALRLLRIAPEYGLRPYGLAFNVGPAAVDAATYARAIDRCGLVMRRLEQLGTRLEMLGLGGALGGSASDPAVLAALARLPYRPPLLISEP